MFLLLLEDLLSVYDLDRNRARQEAIVVKLRGLLNHRLAANVDRYLVRVVFQRVVLIQEVLLVLDQLLGELVKLSLDVWPMKPVEVFIDVPFELGISQVEDALSMVRLFGLVLFLDLSVAALAVFRNLSVLPF